MAPGAAEKSKGNTCMETVATRNTFPPPSAGPRRDEVPARARWFGLTAEVLLEAAVLILVGFRILSNAMVHSTDS